MKDILEEIATSIEDAIGMDWTIKKQRPVWTDQHSGKTLYVYLDSDRPAPEFRVTGSTQLVYRYALEYVEPADLEAGQLSKGDDVALDMQDTRTELMRWAFDHDSLENAWRFDYVGTTYDNPRRPLDLQGFTAFVEAWTVEAYG